MAVDDGRQLTQAVQAPGSLAEQFAGGCVQLHGCAVWRRGVAMIPRRTIPARGGTTLLGGKQVMQSPPPPPPPPGGMAPPPPPTGYGPPQGDAPAASYRRSCVARRA